MYLDDFTIGQIIRTKTLFVHEAAIYDFALTYDPQAFHLDPKHPHAEALGGLFASGYHGLSLALRLSVDTGMFEHNIIGLGMENVRWISPLMAGTTIVVENRVLSSTPSRSKPDRGVLKFLQQMKNVEDDMVLMEATIAVMMERQG